MNNLDMVKLGSVLEKSVRALDESQQARVEAARRMKEHAVELAQIAGQWSLAEKGDTPSGDDAAERTAGETIVHFMKTTDAFRKQLLEMVDKVENLKLPGREESQQSFVQALEAADQLLESMGDTVWSDFTPLLKKYGYSIRR